MKLKLSQQIAGTVLACLLGAHAQAQAPDIPASVAGTYTLTYDFVQSGSPFTQGTVKTFVLNGDTDTLCVDGVSLGTGYFRSGSGSEMLWSAGDGVYYALSLRDGGTVFNEINVYSPSDAGSNWKGQFPGPGTYSSAVTCGGSATPTLSAAQEEVIGIAFSLYPDLFESHGEVKSAQGYTYVTFDSGVSVGFKDGDLYVAGGPFGADIQNKGTIAQVKAHLEGLVAANAITPTADMISLFEYAAQVYPNLFTNGTSFQTSADGYLYKFFDSGVYAAIKDGVVYVRGGQFGSAYTSVGALNNVLNQLQTAVGGNNGGGSIPEGDYNLAVTGTVTSFGISTGISFTVANTPAPNTNNLDEIKQAFLGAIKDLEGTEGLTVTNFTYTVVSNTSSLVEFDAEVAASITQPVIGNVGFTYKMNFKYTK